MIRYFITIEIQKRYKKESEKLQLFISTYTRLVAWDQVFALTSLGVWAKIRNPVLPSSYGHCSCSWTLANLCSSFGSGPAGNCTKTYWAEGFRLVTCVCLPCSRKFPAAYYHPVGPSAPPRAWNDFCPHNFLCSSSHLFRWTCRVPHVLLRSWTPVKC